MRLNNAVEKELLYPYKANYHTAEKNFVPVCLGNGIFSGLTLNSNSPKMFNRGIPQKFSVRSKMG